MFYPLNGYDSCKQMVVYYFGFALISSFFGFCSVIAFWHLVSLFRLWFPFFSLFSLLCPCFCAYVFSSLPSVRPYSVVSAFVPLFRLLLNRQTLTHTTRRQLPFKKKIFSSSLSLSSSSTRKRFCPQRPSGRGCGHRCLPVFPPASYCGRS